MTINTVGLMMLVAGFIVFFGGNYLLTKKYNRYEKAPENPVIGSADPQVDGKESIKLLTYFSLRTLWFVLSIGLAVVGGMFYLT